MLIIYLLSFLFVLHAGKYSSVLVFHCFQKIGAQDQKTVIGSSGTYYGALSNFKTVALGVLFSDWTGSTHFSVSLWTNRDNYPDDKLYEFFRLGNGLG